MGLLHGYHPGGVGIKTKVAQFDELIILMYFLTASNLNMVDMGWASSMIITLVELKSKQKLLSLMN